MVLSASSRGPEVWVNSAEGPRWWGIAATVTTLPKLAITMPQIGPGKVSG